MTDDIRPAPPAPAPEEASQWVGVGVILFAIAAVIGIVMKVLADVPLTGCNPRPASVLMGVLAVVGGAMVASYCGYLAYHTRNWIYLVAAAGSVLFIIGVVGQRAYGPTQDPSMHTVCAAGATTSGAWAASVQLPIFNASVDPIAMAGVLVTVAGLCGVLLFERIGETPPPTGRGPGRFEDADTI